ncbi:nestin-like isoform X3 [Carassius gibelio]|uniref:nestin-like isoform X3 n=1 Tax=Carassius gibelio TaxID=101364 RepID=UPI0022774EE2|nr:nestin-like isoform X3 [Carassius gibelio]
MELLGGRVPFTQFQEEKYQMLELNQRLESYLGHVKLLEEENKLLREEVHTLKSSKEPPGQRKAQEEALSQARRMLEEAWRKKDCVVMEVENLMEDIEVVSIQRQKAKNAKAEAQRKLMESRKELEEERRAQIWLREKSGQLEKDLLLQMQVHQENMETLHDSLKQTKQVLMTPQPTQTTSIPDLGQEYSYRAAQAWQEATNNYQRLVGRLEESLNQAKANMAKIHQEKRENQHQVQHLAKELESTKTKRQMLEKNVVQQREEHTQELQYLQAQVDALELEKDSLGQQIDSLMVDRQNLLQVKMSLGMEVVTYRALLDSEGQRIDRPTTKMTSSAFFLDVFSKPTGTQPASQTTAASCHVSNTVSTRHRSITSSHTLLTRATPSWTPTRGTPQRTPTSTSVTEKTKVHISEQTEKAAEESVDHVQQEKVHEDMVLKTTLPAAEPEPQLKPEDSEIKEDETIQFMKAQMVECKTDASALISVSADQPSNLSQTSETEIWAGPFTDPAGDSEEKKHEDTEVSFVMAQITCAPKVACEENKTIADYEKDDACKMDVRSENISESHTFAYGDAENNDDDALKSSHISANTSIMGSSFLEQGTLDMAGDFGYHEDLMTVDKQDNVSNISEEGREQMNSGTDAVIDSMKEMDRQEEIEPENEMKVVSPDSEEEEQDEMNIDADTKFTKEDEYLTEIEEEEIEVIKSDFSVLDEGVDSSMNSDHQESLEKTVLPTEPHSDQTVNEEDPSKPEDTEIKEDEPILFTKAQMVECKTDASAFISASADQPSNLSQTSETEIWAGPFTDPAGDSEEKKDEDTEVSFVMAQISRAPKVACEENKTIAKDENIDNSEIDVRSENISESHTFAYGDAENNDDDALKSSHISANTSIMGSSFLEKGTLDMAGDFGYHEDLMTVDKQDNVSNISEEGKEQMNSGTDAAIDSVKEMDRQEEIEPENEMKVASPDSEEEEEDEMNIDADTKVTKEDTNVTEIEEEEIEVIKSDFSVPDEVVDSSMNSDHQESLEKTVLPTEPHSDQTVNEEDPSKPEDPEIKENEPIQFMKAQMVECKTDAPALISASADKPNNLSQTSETEIWAGPFTDPAGDSEEGKHEDTEVSFVMAQFSHSPEVACEENITIAKDENDDTFEIDVRSENISESHTFAYGDAENNDDDALKSSHISANTSIMGSSFLEQGTLDMAGDFGYHEDLMTVDKQDNVSNISEEGKEQMNSGTDAAIDSVKEMDRQEEINADKNKKKEHENVTEIEEEEIELIKSDFSVPDEGVDSPKNSDHQESLEKTVLPTEPHSDQTVNEEDPSKPEDTEIKENEPILFTKAQMVECKTDASALISVSADKPSNLSQTSETEIWAGPFTDPAGDSEEKKDEDTEVSFVMAQISRAPKVACEENKTIAKDKNIDNSEIDVRSENISESHTFAYGDAENHDDDDALKSSHISTHTSIMGSSFLEQGTLDMAGDFAYHEDLMTVDTQDNVSNISEEGKEQMNSGTEAVIDSMKEMDRQEEIEPENEMKVVSPDSVEEEEDEMNIDADTKVTKEDTNVTEIEEEEIEVIKSDFSVPDEVVDSSMNSDHQESLEKTVLPTEPHSDQTVNEEDPSKPEDPEIKENEPIQFMKAQMVECKTDASTFISASADQPSNLSQTSETEIWAGPFTDPAGDSEEGKHEDTEVSFEMAQISRAPKVACEENITIAKDENDDTFEIDVRSENISESHTFAYGDAENNDDDALKSSHISANTSIMGSSFLEQGTLDMAGDFGYHEDLMTVDKQDNVSNISEEGKEQMNSGTDAAIDSVKEMDRQEEIEPENEMKVVSPDSEEEEEDEMNIDADTKVTKEDTNVTEIEEEEIEVIKIKSDFSVLDEGVDSSMNSDHQESLEKTVLPTEPHSDQTVNEEESFPEEAVGEEENQGEDDDSPNIAFCRNDPGECDSYSPENTLADTRPLIHHKSDEETKGNVQASHLIGETSDSEGEKERMEGANLKEGASKHFNTMEDLTEEPDMEVTGEMVTEDNVSKEEVQDSDMTCIKPQSDSEVHERIELKGNLEEHSDFITEMRKAEDHDVKAYEQPQLTENQHMHTEQPEDETVHSYESQEHPISFPETSHQLKNLFETPSTLTMFQDAAATKNSEDLMEASMHTNVDLKLSRSLESKISSQPDSMTSDIPNSDQEEGNSSEDESPNASQCFQSTSLLTVATLKKLPFTFTNGVSKADSVSDVNYLPEEALSKEKNTEEPKTPQTDDWENSDIWSKSMNAPDATEIMHASSMDENTGVFQVNETESLEISNKTAENIFGKFEEQFERTLESFSEKVLSVMDCESTSSGENEEFQSKEKKSEIHSFFSTSMKEDFWSQGKLEMVATYDPAKTEDLDQAMVFGEEWRDMERMPTENLSPKEKMAILEGQEEKHKDKKPAQGKMVLSDDSVDEGDSWSSGDE